MVQIQIPKKELKSDFTTYAEGVFLHEEIENNHVHIFLDDNYPMTLYYTFRLHRRLFICTKSTNNTNIVNFPNVNKELTVIAELRGRTFSRYKEAMSYLNKTTKGRFYRFPVQFFWQLSELCRNGKNSNLNINKLVDYYDYLHKKNEVRHQDTMSY